MRFRVLRGQLCRVRRERAAEGVLRSEERARRGAAWCSNTIVSVKESMQRGVFAKQSAWSFLKRIWQFPVIYTLLSLLSTADWRYGCNVVNSYLFSVSKQRCATRVNRLKIYRATPPSWSVGQEQFGMQARRSECVSTKQKNCRGDRQKNTAQVERCVCWGQSWKPLAYAKTSHTKISKAVVAHPNKVFQIVKSFLLLLLFSIALIF